MKEQLKTVYESVTFKDWVRFDANRFSGNIEKKLSSFNRDIILRDFREAAAAVVLFVIYCYQLIFSDLSTSKTIASWVMLAACVLIVAVLYWGKRPGKNIYTLPTIEFLRIQRNYLVRQRNLLRNVLFWYIGPILLSFLIGFWDRAASMFSPDKSGIVKAAGPLVLVFIVIFVAGVFVVVTILNRKAAKKIQPIIDEVDDALIEMEDTSRF